MAEAHKLVVYAQGAKAFITEAGEGMICDELLMRAAVVYGMLERGGKIGPHDDFDRSHVIALIAHGFDDHPPSTPHRAALFAADIDRGTMPEVSRG